MIIQAAAEGVVDFRSADPLDPAWWRHLRLRLQVLQARNETVVDQLWAAWYFATLQRPNLTQQSLDSLLNGVENCMNQITRRLFPWERVEAGRDKAVKDLRDQWVQVYGDPEDPETKAKIDATVAMLRSRDKKQ